MKGLAVAFVALVVTVAQYSVAPLFPVAGTAPDLAIIALALLTAFAGVGPMLIAVPATAIMLGLISDRSVFVLMLAYVPLLPLAYALETDLPYKLPTFARIALVVALSTVWARLLQGALLIGGGAAFEPVALATTSILPGLFLNTLAFLLIYGILRGVRLEPVSLPQTEAVPR